MKTGTSVETLGSFGTGGTPAGENREKKDKITGQTSQFLEFSSLWRKQGVGGSSLHSSLLSNTSGTQNSSKGYTATADQVFVHLPGNSTITVFLKEKCIPALKEPTLKRIFGMQSV